MAERAETCRRRHTRLQGDWSSDVCSSDLPVRRGDGEKQILVAPHLRRHDGGAAHEHEGEGPDELRNEVPPAVAHGDRGGCEDARAERHPRRSEERRVGKEWRWRREQRHADDGIRDYKVTGVQTCALPICPCAAATVRSRFSLRPICAVMMVAPPTNTRAKVPMNSATKCRQLSRMGIGEDVKTRGPKGTRASTLAERPRWRQTPSCRFSTTAALMPPKPKLLLNAYSTSASRPCFGM